MLMHPRGRSGRVRGGGRDWAHTSSRNRLSRKKQKSPSFFCASFSREGAVPYLVLPTNTTSLWLCSKFGSKTQPNDELVVYSSTLSHVNNDRLGRDYFIISRAGSWYVSRAMSLKAQDPFDLTSSLPPARSIPFSTSILISPFPPSPLVPPLSNSCRDLRAARRPQSLTSGRA